MTTSRTAGAQTGIHALWQELTAELADIFDAHGVCDTVANTIALRTGTQTVVGLTSQVTGYFDVWVCSGDGRSEQTRWSVAQATFDSHLTAEEAAWQEKVEQPAATLVDSELWQLARERILTVPLPLRPSLHSITPAGILCLIDPDPECLLSQDNIELLAIHLTTYLDRAFLRQRSNQQELEFHVVSDISHAITSTLSLDRVFRELAYPMRQVLNVELISIGLVEPVSGDIVFVSELMGPKFQDLPPIRLKPGQGIAGWVVEHALPQIVTNAYKDKRFYSKSDHISGFHTRSKLCVPIKVEQRVIGVLEAINKQVGEFNENDLRLLQAVSGPLAAAIENAKLHTDVLNEKQRIQTIFSSMSEGMLTIDANGRITSANDALLTLLRRDLDTLRNQRADEMIRLRDGDIATFMAEVLVSEGEHHQLASELIQGPEEFVPVLLSGAPIENEEGEVNEAILVFSDLRQIREVERMRDDFFHNIVHELRTPLATILMYARLLREGKAGDDQAKADRFLGVIERESDRLQTMVRQTLQLAKLEAREIQRSSELVNLNHLFDEVIPPLAERATQKGLTFSQWIKPDLPPVTGNRETIYVIFKNLIENAVKFTLSGTVRVDARTEGDKIRVIVKDEGIGIPEAALPNLFKRFYRARTAVERGIAGTGLGLYMVKEGIEKHQGSLEVSSVENEGTTFTVHLPAAST